MSDKYKLILLCVTVISMASCTAIVESSKNFQTKTIIIKGE